MRAILTAAILAVSMPQASALDAYRFERPKTAKPGKWCGWFMRGARAWVPSDPGREFDVARAWARYGLPAWGPGAGVIVVWPHHVGVVTAVLGPDRIEVVSGNDRGAVRRSVRSTRGVIAWRRPSMFTDATPRHFDEGVEQHETKTSASTVARFHVRPLAAASHVDDADAGADARALIPEVQLHLDAGGSRL